MGGILSRPKPPPPPPIIQQSQDAQEKILAKQEQREADREKDEMKRVQAKKRARRYGGMRLLLSQERDDPQLGLSDKLGG
tara:strand:- start:3165 stop:3404 length:240 start_codon:yes stop_codon:yes gene_type:complete